MGVDFNIDVIYFHRPREIGLFISPPQVQTGVTGGSSLSGGIIWGVGSPDGYAGAAFVQGMHTPPFVIPVGEIVIPVPGTEFERGVSSGATTCYLGVAFGLEAGVYEEPSFAVRLWYIVLP